MKRVTIILGLLVFSLFLTNSLVFGENITVVTGDAPKAVGPYSQGKIIEVGYGKMLFSAGQIAIDPITGKMADNKIALQTDQVMKNLVAILKAADMRSKDVVSVTVYLRRLSDFKEFNLIYGKYFSNNLPARQTIGGVDLPAKALVEVAVVAFKKNQQ